MKTTSYLTRYHRADQSPTRAVKNIKPVFCMCWAALVLALAPISSPVQAATASPPDLMAYQGYLVDENGMPLGNAAPKNFDVVFRIWSDQLSGDRLWAEQQTITIDKGYFSVLLGEGAVYSGEPHPALSSLFAGTGASDRFIEVMVKGIGAGGSDVTITPRLRLLTSPYAFLTQTAVNAQNLVSSTSTQVVSVSGSNVGINKASPTSPLDVNGTVKATTFSGSGSGLTSLPATSLTGTVADARLSGNVAKLNATQTFTANNIFAENLQIGTSSADYQHLQLGGGNSWGYLYGSYPAPLGNLKDAIHLGYNYYYDAAGNGQTANSGGSTSRLSVGYGRIELATGGTATAPSPRLLVNAAGNVGIGETSPGFPLNFPSTAGDKISLYGNGGNHYGFGISNNVMQIHTSVSSADVVFGYGQSSSLTETMRIKGNGDVIVSGALYGSAPYLKYAEVTTGTTQLTGSAGAAFVGVNNWRNFNNELSDTDNLGSLSGGNIVLAAGTYQCRISAPGFRVQNHQIRLRTSAGVNLLYGTVEYSDESAGGEQTRSQIGGQFTLNASTTLRVQHFCGYPNTYGLGNLLTLNWGDANQNIWAVAEFWKIK